MSHQNWADNPSGQTAADQDRRREPDRLGAPPAPGATGPADATIPAARLGIDLAVPLYVHPADDLGAWQAVAQATGHVRFIILNVHNGVGADLDQGYPPVIELLRAARVRMVGYVDTAYTRRTQHDVVDEIETWVSRYGVHGVFFDQVSGTFEDLQYYASCALAARAAGAQFVVFNPGTGCDPAYAEIGNVTVTFEGTWHDYQNYQPPTWARGLPPTRFCHLVYDVPTHCFAVDAPAAVENRHAATAFFSTGTGANPWDRLDQALLTACAHTVPGLVPSMPASWSQRRYVTEGPPPAPTPTAPQHRRQAWRAATRDLRHRTAARQQDATCDATWPEAQRTSQDRLTPPRPADRAWPADSWQRLIPDRDHTAASSPMPRPRRRWAPRRRPRHMRGSPASAATEPTGTGPGLGTATGPGPNRSATSRGRTPTPD